MPQSHHQKRKHKHKPGSLLFNPNQELEKVDALIEAGDTVAALAELKRLAQRLPHRVEVFETMFMLAMQLQDHHERLEPAIRRVEQAEQAGELWSEHADPFLLHLGGRGGSPAGR